MPGLDGSETRPHTDRLAFGHRGVNFQILRFDDGVSGVAHVVLVPVLSEVVSQGFLGGLVQAGEGGLSGAKIFSEEGYRISGAKGYGDGFQTRPG